MTQSAKASQKSERLTAAAVRVLHERGVERSTLADIAREAEVPVGNVYYYFKTKDDLVRAALAAHRAHQDELFGRLDGLTDPRERLTGLIENWIDLREVAARRGCPTTTLAAELGKREDDVLGAETAAVFRRLIDWVTQQFREMGRPDPDDVALGFVSAYQGMSLLANALRDPEVMRRGGAQLLSWIGDAEQPSS
jgi:TetR/AcrR family transcriptional regulator, transcriptional repressor for nem operon